MIGFKYQRPGFLITTQEVKQPLPHYFDLSMWLTLAPRERNLFFILCHICSQYYLMER